MTVPGAGDVSVVIPTFNRRDRLERVLSALALQDVSGFEVVVVSDGSTDGTAAYLRSSELPLAVVVVEQANAGPAVARNRGVHAASRDLILFLDDDVVPSPQLVRAHVDAHGRLGMDVVVIGPMLTPPDHEMAPWVRWEQAMLQKQYDALARGDYAATARQFYTGNASVRRCHLVDVGGFDPAYRRAEDVELAFRLRDRGLMFAYDPRAVGLHYAERSFATWLDIAWAYGRNDVAFGRDPGRTETESWISRNYRRRHPFVRAVTRVAVGRPRTAATVTRSLRAIADLGDAARMRAVNRQALSGIYNLAYYRGVAEALGGAEELWALLDRNGSS